MSKIVCCKDEFINEIDKWLITKGLQKNENNWEKSFQVQGQGMVMNINGQQFQQPGEIISMKYNMSVVGEGSVDNVPFLQISFQVKQGDDLVVDTEECIYYNEIEIIKNITNQIFR